MRESISWIGAALVLAGLIAEPYPAHFEALRVGGGHEDATGGADFDHQGNMALSGDAWIGGDLTVDGAMNLPPQPVEAGEAGVTRGVVTAWRGGNEYEPGVLKLQSAEGPTWYLFVTEHGTVRVHNELPTSPSDGELVGTQY